MSSHDRWRPARAGIVNLYEYGDQVFEFGDGRLLLRGHNTSGKTKALELLLPFCLDGDISPRKLDPFASDAKDMKWNLVGCIEREQRVGYAWLEFERRDDDGDVRRLTCGVGMRAHRNVAGVTRWYFVARDLRIGADVSLLRGREPIGRAELDAALGDAGEVLDGQRAYRARLNDLLFGFGGEEQYRSMLRLMLELRRPHLSKTLDPGKVAELLAAGLPEIDPELMRRLAGGLEQLETLERRLERLRMVRDRVRSFHERTYRTYLRAVVRERADRLRAAQTAVEAASARLRDVLSRLAQERERRAALEERRGIVATELECLEGAERALVASQAWRSIEAVEALRDQAQARAETAAALARVAEDAAAGAAVLEGELAAATAAVEDARVASAQELAAVERAAADAGLAGVVAVLAAQLREAALPAESWAALVRDAARDRQAVLREHDGLVAAAQAAADETERRREAERDAAAAVAAAAERTAAGEAALEEERRGLAAAAAAWRRGLAELRLDEDAADAALERALDGLDPGPVLADAAEEDRAALAAEAAEVAGAVAGAETARAAAEDEIRRLEAQQDEGPPPPAWPRTPRGERAGAALWRLVDVVAGVEPAALASVEAALDAMGILDAWVRPDGTVADRRTLDVLLVAGPPLPGHTLADVLAPAAAAGVPSDVIRGVLRRIALVGDAHTASDEVALDLRGGFRLGPLTGTAGKPVAEHLGAAARAARRARRLADLHARVNELEAELASLAERGERLRARRVALAAELAAFPSRDAVVAALRAVDVAAAAERAAARAFDRAAAAAREAADEQIAAEARRREHAVAHGLAPTLDASAIARLRDAAAELLGRVGAAAAAHRHAASAAAGAAALHERLSAARETADARASEAAGARAEAERLAAEHATRASALGAEAEQLRAEHERLVVELRTRRAERSELDAKRDAAVRAEAALEGDERACSAETETARAARAGAAAGFSALGAAGVLSLVLGDEVPDDAAASGEWSFTRTLEVARALPDRLLAVRSHSAELAVEVMRRVQELDRQLADAELSAFASRDDGDLLLVRIAEGAGERSLPAVLAALDDEIAEREEVLSAEERRVFGDALVDELADHLRARIHAVHEQVAAMNAVLLRTPTAAGKTVQLEWRAIDEEADGQREAVELLRRRLRDAGDDARARLVAFFRARVEDARRRRDGVAETMADTLMRAFDYRRWFAFGLLEQHDGRRERLTRRRHAVGSGGEQSVLIHLPLFAAAAVLYGDGTAPRLVMLDEALSGIDDDTRERVLAASVAFDLDIVMTSHELWGTYASVPRLGIYQLHRENGAFGVHAIPFVWDGAVLHEGEQAALTV